MSKKRHVPIRMCIGCRKKRKKEELIRFIKDMNGLILSNGIKDVNGRGFYLCPDRLCFKKAQKYKWVGSLGPVDQCSPSTQRALHQ
jgi:predicted RNA-binding protein YlxR (DUF448 family)